MMDKVCIPDKIIRYFHSRYFYLYEESIEKPLIPILISQVFRVVYLSLRKRTIIFKFSSVPQ